MIMKTTTLDPVDLNLNTVSAVAVFLRQSGSSDAFKIAKAASALDKIAQAQQPASTSDTVTVPRGLIDWLRNESEENAKCGWPKKAARLSDWAEALAPRKKK